MGTGQNSHSHKRDDNAWAEFAASHGPGTVVRGMVSQVDSHGVIVRIAPDVVGSAPLEEIAPYAVDDPQDALWPEDIVEAIVTDIELPTKRIWLSIKQLVSQRAGKVGSAVSPIERERFWETASFSESLRLAACPDVSEWPFGRILEQAHRQGAPAEKLNGSLQAVLQETGSVAAAVFRLDLVTEAVTTVTKVGISSSESSDLCRDLRFSPLEEIWQGQTVFENMVQQQDQVKFHKLLHLLDFDALMGIPVVTEGRTSHALVLFARGVEYQQQDLLAAIVASMVIGSILEKAHIEQHQWSVDRFATLGRFSAAVFHEIHNHLAQADFSLENLRHDIRRSTGSAEASTTNQATLNERVGRAAESIRAVRELMSQSMDAFRQDEARPIELGRVLEIVARMLQPLAHRQRVRLHLELGASIPRLYGVRRRLEQACLNMAVYAIEQATYSHRGMVAITTSSCDGRPCPIEVRFEDSGPGIHRKAWDRIFDLGYGTRSDDLGIGLYAARSIVESLGGCLFVEDSIMFLGTTFLMQLPAMTDSLQGERDAW